jgi:hypothetical protein
LDSFVGEVFSPLTRKDRRAAAGLYVRGLMLDGRRKSMQPMAQRLRVDHQRLQQFVTSSPWDVEPVGKTLSRKACTLLEPDAWVIDDTGFVKDGDASSCVARQYSGTLGKVGNCQVAISVHAASDPRRRRWTGDCMCPNRDARCAGDPADAAAVAARRKRCAIPDTEHHRPKWQMIRPPRRRTPSTTGWPQPDQRMTPPLFPADLFDSLPCVAVTARDNDDRH